MLVMEQPHPSKTRSEATSEHSRRASDRQTTPQSTQHQPSQHLSSQNTRLQRTIGRGGLSVQTAPTQPNQNPDQRETILKDLRQGGAAKIRFPRKIAATPGQAFEAVMINTAGGLTGGDDFAWDISVAQKARLSLSTQACEKIYRASDGAPPALVDVTLKLAKDAHLAWLPQETILFDQSRLRRRLSLHLDAGASALIAEGFILGRRDYGEHHLTFDLRDSWRVYVDGALAHAEEMRVREDDHDWMTRPSGAGGAGAFATVLYIGAEAENFCEAINKWLAHNSGQRADLWGGASCWAHSPNREDGANHAKLVTRLLAKDGYMLRKGLLGLIALLQKQQAPPLMWSL